jgi:ribulose-phosphate 3-epimerase
MTIIAPSLLACDFLNIESELKPFENQPNLWFHLDIMDGHFVPNLTFGHPIVSLIAKKTQQKLDAHLMVSNPQFHIETLKNFGIYNITFHLESCSNPLELIEQAKAYYPSVGISVKPDTSLDILNPKLLNNIDLLLIMSVMPGKGGQSFLEDTWDRLTRIKQIRTKLGANFMIQVDGGINADNAHRLIEKGAENLVAGSYIFKVSPDEYINRVNLLRK